MNFPSIHEDPCPASPSTTLSLIIKPEVSVVCQATSTQQFKAYTRSDAAGETEVAATWTSSNTAVATINAASGLATLVAAGISTIMATYGSLTAYAQLEVIMDTNCCDPLVIANLVAIDHSDSMRQVAGGMSRLTFAKAAAKAFFAEIRWDKDVGGLLRFTTSGVEVRAISSTQVPDATVDSIAQTTRQTDLLRSLTDALALLTAETVDRRVLVLISDGEHRPDPNGVIPDSAAILALATEFKSGGGIIVCLGCAAAGDGFALLQNLATAGFFINASTAEQISDALDTLPRLLCYFCGGLPPVYGGCLDAPIPDQNPKASPLADIEIV